MKPAEEVASVYEREGTCLVFSGYEDDWLDFDNDLVSLTELVQELTGVRTPGPDTLSAFICNDRQYERARVEEYRATSGRKWPPIYRVKLRVEVETLGDAETEAYWTARQAQQQAWKQARQKGAES